MLLQLSNFDVDGVSGFLLIGETNGAASVWTVRDSISVDDDFRLVSKSDLEILTNFRNQNKFA